MKKGFFLVLALSVAVCSCARPRLNNFDKLYPQVVAGDESFVVLYDPNLIVPPDAKQKATRYCSSYGKTAEWKSLGGDYRECLSNQLSYCVTYACK